MTVLLLVSFRDEVGGKPRSLDLVQGREKPEENRKRMISVAECVA